MSFNPVTELRSRETFGKSNFNSYYDQVLSTLDSNNSRFSLSDNTILEAPLFSCKFCPQSRYNNLIAIANEDGTLCFNDSEKNDKIFYAQPHQNAIFDLAWMPNDSKLVTCSGDHSSKLLDLGKGSVEVVSKFIGHVRSVKSVSFKPQNSSVFATGSRDGSLIIWDTRSSTKCSTLPLVHTPDQILHAYVYPDINFQRKQKYPTRFSVTGVLFQDDNTLISCGASDSCVQLWDMRRTYSKSKNRPTPKCELFTFHGGYSSLTLNHETTKLYVNCLDSSIYCFNLNSTQIEPIAAFFGHSVNSFYVKSCLSADGKYLISGSSDEYVYIWNTEKIGYMKKPRKPLLRLRGHVAEVTGVDTCVGNELKIVSSSDDSSYRIWSLNMKNKKGESLDKDSLVEDVFDGLVTPVKKTKLHHKSNSVPRKSRTPDGNIIKYFSESKKLKTTPESVRPRNLKENTMRSKRKLMDILEEEEEENGVESKSKRIALSPVKVENRLSNLEGMSPIRKTYSQSDITSPTVNLPNFVIDGTSPYSHKCPSLKRPADDLDWLSKLRKEKERKYDKDSDYVTNEKRNVRSNSTDKKPSKTLLNYFKLCGKSNDS